MSSIANFVGAAFAEIAGCFAFWAWARLGKSAWLLLPGVASLIVFPWLLTRVEAAFAGRAYAAYGGVYIAASLAWAHQQRIYDLLIGCAWQSVHTFSRNDRQLQGTPGAIAVLHTNTRRLDYHPHVHLVMPAAAIDGDRKRWCTKRSRQAKARYLFNHKALAKVFRAKMLAGIEAAGLALPPRHPSTWVVDCKSVGSGEKALAYLGRYLYRGVIREKDIERNESVPGLTSVPQDRRILLDSAGRDKVRVETPNQVNGRARPSLTGGSRARQGTRPDPDLRYSCGPVCRCFPTQAPHPEIAVVAECSAEAGYAPSLGSRARGQPRPPSPPSRPAQR